MKILRTKLTKWLGRKIIEIFYLIKLINEIKSDKRHFFRHWSQHKQSVYWLLNVQILTLAESRVHSSKIKFSKINDFWFLKLYTIKQTAQTYSRNVNAWRVAKNNKKTAWVYNKLNQSQIKSLASSLFWITRGKNSRNLNKWLQGKIFKKDSEFKLWNDCQKKSLSLD